MQQFEYTRDCLAWEESRERILEKSRANDVVPQTSYDLSDLFVARFLYFCAKVSTNQRHFTNACFSYVIGAVVLECHFRQPRSQGTMLHFRGREGWGEFFGVLPPAIFCSFLPFSVEPL